MDYVELDGEINAAQTLHDIRLDWSTDRLDQRIQPLDREFQPPYTGRGVDIYILDSGISYSHTVFGGRAQYGGYDHFGDDGKDCNGHGTHVAGLAGGNITGVAVEASLYSIKILNCRNSGSYSGLLSGLNFVVSRVRKTGRRSVVSMSLIGPFSKAANEAVRKAESEGIIVVVAAGNFKRDACDYSPASSEEAITVGGTKERNDGLYWFNTFSSSPGTNYGKCVDVFAPGQYVLSAAHSSDEHLVQKSGTSMATPLVSGAVALLLEEDPSLTPKEIKQLLITRCTKEVIDFSPLPTTASEITPNCLIFTGKKNSSSTTPPTTSPSTTPPTTSSPSTTPPTTSSPSTTPPTTSSPSTTPPTTSSPSTTPPTTNTPSTTPPTTNTPSTTPPTTNTPSTMPPTTNTPSTTPPTTSTVPVTPQTTSPPSTLQPSSTPPPTNQPSSVPNKLSLAVSQGDLQEDITSNLKNGFTVANTISYKARNVWYFSIIYKHVGNEHKLKYLHLIDLSIEEANEVLADKSLHAETFALYEDGEGIRKVFLVLLMEFKPQSESILSLDLSKTEWKKERDLMLLKGYKPAVIRYRAVPGEESLISTIYKRTKEAYTVEGLTVQQLVNVAYNERKRGNYMMDISYDTSPIGAVSYTAIFDRMAFYRGFYYVNVRISRSNFQQAHKVLRNSGFYVTAVTPIHINTYKAPGYLAAYWH